MKDRKILTVIPARGGSKGIQRKNICLIDGRPLIYYPIKAAQKSKKVDRFIISTDNEEIAEIAKSFGVEVPFMRPTKLAVDYTTLIHVMKHTLDFFDAKGEFYDAILSLQATTPLISPEIIDEVISKFNAKKCKAVVTVSKIRHGHPYLSKRIIGKDNDELIDFVDVPKNIELYPRQKRETAYYCNGAVFLRDRGLLEKMDTRTNCLGQNPTAVIMEDKQSVNIDDIIDMKIAEYLLQNKSLSSI